MSLRHAVLGFLSLRPLTGYDLKKYFDSSVRHFWTADQAQIYRMLARLVDECLVDVHVVAQLGRPDRREHHVTAAGIAELDEWLRSPLDPQPTREPFLVKVFFAGRMTAADLANMIDARMAATQQQLAVLRQIAVTAAAMTAVDGEPASTELLLRSATLENGVRHTETELAWLRDLRHDLDDPAAWAERMRRRLA